MWLVQNLAASNLAALLRKYCAFVKFSGLLPYDLHWLPVATWVF